MVVHLLCGGALFGVHAEAMADKSLQLWGHSQKCCFSLEVTEPLRAGRVDVGIRRVQRHGPSGCQQGRQDKTKRVHVDGASEVVRLNQLFRCNVPQGAPDLAG